MFINPSSKKSKVYWINSEGVRNQMNMDIKSFLPSLMVIPLYMKENKLPPYLLSGGALFKAITKLHIHLTNLILSSLIIENLL